MTAKKTPAKRAAKKKPTPKVGQPAAKGKKVEISATPKTTEAKKATPAKPKTPGWFKKSPTDYIVGTEDYRRLVHFHNENFGTSWNVWRVQPQVFVSIHQTVTNHFADKK